MAADATLTIHPAERATSVRGITASIARGPGDALALRYALTGRIADLRLPAGPRPVREDGLWQHSCFEAFLLADGGESYHEFNFATDGAWQAYRFAARRAHRAAPPWPAPRITFESGAESCVMTVALSLASDPALAGAVMIHAGLAAVIEDANGVQSHWALAHAGATADFHDPTTFRLRLDAR